MKKVLIGLGFLGLVGIGLEITTPYAISIPLDFSEKFGFQKLFPNDVDGATWYYEPNSVKILNRRKKTIVIGTYLKNNKKTDLSYNSYSWTQYIINCVDGTFQENAKIFYNDSGESIFSSTKVKPPEEVADDSDYGKLRDRLCKKFGF